MTKALEQRWERSTRRFLWSLAILGVGVRLALVWLPILDDNNWLRQTQTADAARSLLENGFWPPYGIASWKGDLEAKVIQELPVYSYLSAGLAAVTGDLDLSGRVISAILWLVSYFLVVAIWKRVLTDRQARWAAFLYVVAPLSIEVGIAFQPEMLVQVCGLSFLLLAVRYIEQPSMGRLSAACCVGVIGACVKLPAVFHYYVVFGVLLFAVEGWRVVLRPRYWLFALGTLIPVGLWGRYVDAVNAEHFPEWMASRSLERFSAGLSDLLTPHAWLMAVLYVAIFVVTPLGFLFAVAGSASLFGSGRWRGLLGIWCAATAVFYFVWGPATAMGHAYYNLPALGPAAAVFGIGVARAMEWLGGSTGRHPGAARPLAWSLAIVIGVFALGGSAYLLRQDTQVLRAAQWLSANVPDDDLVIVKSNHSQYTVSYGHVPAYSYYSKRRTWIWTPTISQAEAERALETSDWLLVTKRMEHQPWYVRLRDFVKQYDQEPRDMSWLTGQSGVRQVHDSRLFAVYRLSPPHDDRGKASPRPSLGHQIY